VTSSGREAQSKSNNYRSSEGIGVGEEGSHNPLLLLWLQTIETMTMGMRDKRGYP
jgi:hypothetical protein